MIAEGGREVLMAGQSSGWLVDRTKGVGLSSELKSIRAWGLRLCYVYTQICIPGPRKGHGSFEQDIEGKNSIQSDTGVMFWGNALRIMIIFVSSNERGFLLTLSHQILRTNVQGRCLVSFYR